MQLPQSAARGQGASTASWSGLRVLSLAAEPDATVARASLVSESDACGDGLVGEDDAP